jgi:membrane fusion protein (multidrug efflux system)
VEVAKAEATTIVDDVSSVGSLRARQGVMIRPEVSGRIVQLGFQDGQRVRRGQILVQLDDTLQKAQLQQAQAQASIARTNLARSRELLGQGFVSQAAVDQNAAALEVAEAQVALAQAQLGRMRIVAPFDGMAGIRTVDVGDYVRDGSDIVNLEDMSAMTVAFRLPERYIGRLQVGQPVDVAMDALPGREFKGRVEALDSQVEETGRALLVKARVDNVGATLKPGMFARPRVVFAVRQGAVTVPEEALVPIGNRQLLFKVAEGPPGPNGPTRVAQRLEAKLGLRLPGRVEILEGLKAGDTVVTAGHSRLVRAETTPVRVIDLSRGVPGSRPPGAGGPPGANAAARPASAPARPAAP